MSTEYEVLDLVFSHVYQVKTKKLYNLNNLTINSNKTIAKNAFWTSCISHMLLHTTPPTKERIQIQTSSWSRRHLLSKMPFRATDSFRRWVLALALPAASRVARPNYRPSTRAPTSKAHGRNVAKPVLGEPALRSKKARLKKTTTWPLGLIRLILGVRKATKGGLRLSWTDSNCWQSMLCCTCAADWQSSACSGTSCQKM